LKFHEIKQPGYYWLTYPNERSFDCEVVRVEIEPAVDPRYQVIWRTGSEISLDYLEYDLDAEFIGPIEPPILK
jgi:hypothetical protein